MSSAGRPRRRRRQILISLLLLLVAVPVLLYLAGLIALAIPAVQQRVLATPAASGIEANWDWVGWFPGQAITIHGLNARKGGLEIEGADAGAQLSLASLIRGRIDLSELSLSGGKIRLILDQGEANDLPPEQEPDGQAPPPTSEERPVLSAAQGAQIGLILGLSGSYETAPVTSSDPRRGMTLESPENLARVNRPLGGPLPLELRLLSLLRVSDLKLELCQSEDSEPLLEIRGLGLLPAQELGMPGTISWEGIEFVGRELIEGDSLPLEMLASGALVQGELNCLGGQLQVRAQLLAGLPGGPGMTIESAWLGEPNSRWDSWLGSLVEGIEIDQMRGQVRVEGQALVRSGQFQAKGQLRILRAGYGKRDLIKELTAQVSVSSGQLQVSSLVAQLADDQGWLLGNGILNAGGQLLSVLRFVSGSNLGLGWIDPRARSGQWVADFQPMADPGLWYRDVTVAGDLTKLQAELINPGEFAPLWPQVSAMREQLAEEGAPLGPLRAFNSEPSGCESGDWSTSKPE